MRLVNDLDKRVYRAQFPANPTHIADRSVDSSSNSVAREVISLNAEPVAFGDLADRAGLLDPDDFDEFDVAGEQPVKDNHLRLSKTGRNHEPTWYLWRINKLCKDGDTRSAVELFFHKMLTVDRVMPDRNVIHLLLSGLAEVGDSESAFKVYRKMTELGIPATNSTYSRLFRACTEDIGAWQREHRYRFNGSSNPKEISSQSDLDLLAGPALKRAKGLWVRLHERGFRMNRITYNTLLQTLAKAGDLHACFQALDAMLLGQGGLPPSILHSSMTSPSPTCSAGPLPPFRPDEYTLTAVLTAVLQSFKSGFLVSSLDALRLALYAWHLILPRLPRRQPSLHHFTLLAGIAALTEPKNGRFSLPTSLGSGIGRRKADTSAKNYLEVIPESLPKLREPQPSLSPRILASEKAAKNLLRRVALLASGGDIPSQLSTPSDTTPLAPVSSNSCFSLPNTFSPDWTSPDIVMRSQVNLLLPLPQEGIRIQIPTKKEYPQNHNSLPPWQRLALFGGLEGFLECIRTNFKLSQSPTSPLITKVAALLPPPSENTGAELDRWESALLNAMDSNKVILDLPVFNVLLQRRTTHGLPVDELMSIANRQGLSPDEFTWNCLARGCRTTKQVRDFLTSYSKAAKLTWDSGLPATLAQLLAFLAFLISWVKCGSLRSNWRVNLDDNSMASELEAYVGRVVNIITSDGHSIVGTLKGFDNVINLIVNDSHERVFSPDRGVECVPLGLYIIRGQNVAVVGEVDEDLDSRVDFENLRAEPLNPIIH
ncbi:U6 snRNA associated Sm protein LSm8 [Echinococcus multilocularis]|uniref:U6 snRNA-associated Sm-like protein LSm8 n=1 Tax=Echinococcus multilocularis TaxID=6211 RepID=A0A068YHJ6_ECHMU|nr:U6 snRNA associated Sm protein LSm8 [Echinococcus multilocularis]